MDVKAYVDFSKNVDVTGSLMMAPRPNYPTLEFASIGSSVVTTKYANKIDLSSYSKNIIISDISTESVAGAIKKAAETPYATRIDNTKSDTISVSWTQALGPPLRDILKCL